MTNMLELMRSIEKPPPMALSFGLLLLLAKEDKLVVTIDHCPAFGYTFAVANHDGSSLSLCTEDEDVKSTPVEAVARLYDLVKEEGVDFFDNLSKHFASLKE